MSIRIYGDTKSGNCLKVKWVACHLGLAFDWVEIDILKSESRTPQFMALNPAGQVPLVVLADGRPLAQSNAILIHLAEGSDLIPADAYDRARMLEWMFWEQYSHEPYVAVARFQMAYLGKPREDLDPKLVERGAAALQRLETQLVQTPYLVGDSLTLADVALVAYTRVAHEGGFDLSLYPAVQAWIGRVESGLGVS
ncbi:MULTISPECIES: glutathione S-transferase family protein [unclassified Caulobacter]|uniref:glutathione S-transferase family protein n=1 Tax=unclassified Caulobacter TaxID=2648921 RepID=UPI000D37F9DA|nr:MULTISPECIES: glutathione S-transferase family protein [unclassified Caulobacter]PTS90930.1 glutathione S-transferase family protein [Caulobacter sp. HMWF009]PTT12003.1 glutathione S-transferase family protein [Caulobacter sp. HMWF025]PTT76359.1 glutathione S-transferase family protein [Pseudomonas sp. HMWF010]